MDSLYNGYEEYLVGTAIRDSMPFHSPSKGRLFSDVVTVGLEFEIETRNPDEAYFSTYNTFWRAELDGTLRNNGREYVLKQPQCGGQLVAAIDQLYRSLDLEALDCSDLCSTHVHIDVRDLDYRFVVLFIVLCTLLEDNLFSITKSSFRKNNAYAPSIIDNHGHWSQLLDFWSNGFSVFSNRDNLTDHRKYSSINMESLLRFGSVEFRHTRGMPDKKDLFAFINILISTRDFVSQQRLKYQRIDRQIMLVAIHEFTKKISMDTTTTRNILSLLKGHL